MKVIALIIVALALTQAASFSAEASPYDAAEAYPMDSPDEVLAESDFEADNNVDEIIGEQPPNRERKTQDKAKLQRLIEKWTSQPTTDLVQHPTYGSGTHRDSYASGRHAATYASGYGSTTASPTTASPTTASPTTASPTTTPAMAEIVSFISFVLNMQMDEKAFNAKKGSIIAAMAKELRLPVSEVSAMCTPYLASVDADLDDVFVEEQQASSQVKFQTVHKSKDAAAAKASQAKIEARAKTVASGGKSLDGIKIPKQSPQMKVKEKTVKPVHKSGVSSNSMPNFLALVVAGLTAMLY